MKRTHKLRAIGEAAAQKVIAASSSVSEAARHLGVSRDTLHAWIRQGKVSAPAGSRRQSRAPAVRQTTGEVSRGPRSKSPQAWASGIRRRYELSATEDRLLHLAMRALQMADEKTVPPSVQLAAAGRFQKLVAQLDFEDPRDGEVEKEAQGAGVVRAFPRRA